MISGAWNLSTLETYDSDIFFFSDETNISDIKTLQILQGPFNSFLKAFILSVFLSSFDKMF